MVVCGKPYECSLRHSKLQTSPPCQACSSPLSVMGKLAGVSPRRVLLSFSATLSLVVMLAAAYLFSDGLMAVYVERRDAAETPALAAGSSSVLPQDLRTNGDFSELAQEQRSVDSSRPDEETAYYDDYGLENAESVVEPLLAEEEDEKEEDEVLEEETPVGAAYANVSNEHSFSVRKGFTFPHPQVFLPKQKILSANWVRHLKDYLRSIHPARSLTITVATKSFIPNLLNWLIAANRLVQPPLQHVLVLGFDRDVHTLLSSRRIPCIHVPYSSVLKKLKKGVSTIWMTRLAVIRLLNHWGYDVLQLDTDAVLLKNPRLLFDGYSDYDLVGARGVLPFELGRGSWGFTVCMGAALLRGTQRMETLWNMMHGVKMDKTTDDQKRVNFALFKSKMQWGAKEKQFQYASVGSNRDGVRVAVLPRRYVCRKSCSLEVNSDTFIWHQSGGGHSASWKSKHNLRSTVWFLRPDYASRRADSSVTGLQWLEHITLPGSIDNVRGKLSPAQRIDPMIL